MSFWLSSTTFQVDCGSMYSLKMPEDDKMERVMMLARSHLKELRADYFFFWIKGSRVLLI